MKSSPFGGVGSPGGVGGGVGGNGTLLVVTLAVVGGPGGVGPSPLPGPGGVTLVVVDG